MVQCSFYHTFNTKIFSKSILLQYTQKKIRSGKSFYVEKVALMINKNIFKNYIFKISSMIFGAFEENLQQKWLPYEIELVVYLG